MEKPDAEDDQERRIENCRRRAQQHCDGPVEIQAFADCSADAEEAFWKYVVAFEEAPLTTHLIQLEKAGVVLPSPDSLTDQELTVKLWDAIYALALLRVFLSQTDHLSDRELYTLLWTEYLREHTVLLPFDENSSHQLPILGSGSEEDIHLYLKYYADDDWRRMWKHDFPDTVIPPSQIAPYDRDRLLPTVTHDSKANEAPS